MFIFIFIFDHSIRKHKASKKFKKKLTPSLTQQMQQLSININICQNIPISLNVLVISPFWCLPLSQLKSLSREGEMFWSGLQQECVGKGGRKRRVRKNCTHHPTIRPGIWNVLTWIASFSISQYDIQLVMIGHAQNIILENERGSGGGGQCLHWQMTSCKR